MTIVIADDHYIVRSGVKQILISSFPQFNIHEVENGEELVQYCNNNTPNIVITDISMPIKNGIEAIKEIRKKNISVPILVLSIYADEQYVKHALKAGANGYITKDAANDELIEAVTKIIEGRNYISTSMAEKLASNNYTDRDAHETLSEREQEIFKLIIKGIPLSTIAQNLKIKVSTVSTYRIRILEKMNFKSNAELIKYAVENKLI